MCNFSKFAKSHISMKKLFGMTIKFVKPILVRDDVFSVYLSIDVLYDKLDVRFVISEPKILRWFFEKQKISKRWTHTTVVLVSGSNVRLQVWSKASVRKLPLGANFHVVLRKYFQRTDGKYKLNKWLYKKTLASWQKNLSTKINWKLSYKAIKHFPAILVHFSKNSLVVQKQT